MRKLFWLIPLFFLCACGYHFQGPPAGSVSTISIPYVEGDVNGQLTDQLTRCFTMSGQFRCAYTDGRYRLHTKLVDRHAETIGWRYEKEEDGKIENELISVEGRRYLAAEVQLIDTATDEIVYGPETIVATFDYDYYEPDVVQDLSFVSHGVRRSSVQFSLGQLDSSEAAFDDVFLPLAQKLAKKIVDRIVRSGY